MAQAVSGATVAPPGAAGENIEQDSYNEDEVELKYLRSKPTCFVIFGKPGSGKTTLARRLAQDWHCELVSPAEVILQNVELQTELGIKAKSMLHRGEALPEEMVTKMIEDKINSAEVCHHGYVLDGFPSVCEEYLTIKDQLELIKNFRLKPDFILNVKMPDGDLETRRIGQRVDPLTGEVYTMDVYKPDIQQHAKKPTEGEGEEEEEAEEEAEEEEEELEPRVFELPPETVARLLRRPEDLNQQVQHSIHKYKSVALRIIEDYIEDHDQQQLIELDGNEAVAVLQKQVLAKLNCFTSEPAIMPTRLHDPEEEENSEDVDSDEHIRAMAAKHMVAPRFRWRRSRWLNYCPVALQEGNLIVGRSEYAVGFLDKMYFMSSPEAFAKFLKNPRPYLVPPQPRPPAKLIVVGPPLSGKTSLCAQLAAKYGASVIDMDALLKPRIAEEKAKFLDQVRAETTDVAIEQVKRKLKDQQEAAMEAARLEAERLAAEEAEQRAREAAERERAAEQQPADGTASAAAAAPPENEAGDRPPSSAAAPAAAEDAAAAAEAAAEANAGSSSPKPSASSTPVPQEIEVDSSNPEVQEIVSAAIKQADKLPVSLPADACIDILERAIKELETANRAKAPHGPLNGGWILDNFPRTRDQWSAMLERGIYPDDIITLKDASENGLFLLKRWYALNKTAVDQAVRARQQREAEELARIQEENRRREEEERRRQQEEERRFLEEERQRRIEAGEEITPVDADRAGELGSDHTSATVLSPVAEATEGGETPAAEAGAQPLAAAGAAPDSGSASPPPAPGLTSADDSEDTAAGETQPPSAIDSSQLEKEVPLDGPEFDPPKEKRKEYDREWPSAESIIISTGTLSPLVLNIESASETDLVENAVTWIERKLQHRGWEYTGMDLDEEDEDIAADKEQNGEEDGEEEDEGEEEPDPRLNKKKPLGDTNHFCPVSLKEKNVLWPGNPECSAKYREKVYYMANDDARTAFLENPQKYLPENSPPKAPPLRLLILGAKGSGKSLHARQLAQKLNMFHIQFEERLQEMLMRKSGKNIGPFYEAEQEFKDTAEDAEEDKDLDKFESTFTMEDTPPPPEEDSETAIASAKSSDEQQPPVADEEKQEQPEVEYNEEEEAIKAYLESGMDDSMSPELMEKIIGEWWTKEPFRSQGFILEGFPRTPEEVRWLSEAGYFPDAAIIIKCEASDIIGRLLPPKMDKWKAKRERKIRRRQRQRDRTKKIRDKALAKRRKELTKERDDKRAERAAARAAAREERGRGDDEDEELGEEEAEEEQDDAEDEIDIDAVLAEEFEEEEAEEEEEEETEEEARDRLSNDLAEIYDNDTNRTTSVQDALEEALVPHLELEGGKKPHIIRYQLSKQLRPYVEARESLFERVYPINERLAARLLLAGYKQPSRFGRWCPVQLLEGECMQPMQGIGHPSHPAVYRSHIYFLSSAEARENFVQHPLKYLKQPSPKPVVPIRLAIIGPPKCGKTTLARRFADEFGLVRVSIGEALRRVLTQQPKSSLAKELDKALRRGATAPDDLAIAALEVALMDMQCVTRGYVLDGFPINKRQIELMTERRIIPVRVIEITCANMEVMIRATKDRLSPDRPYPKHDSSEILTVRINSIYKTIDEVRLWYKEQHMNHVVIPGERSKWWVWNEVLTAAKDSVCKIQTYLQRTSEGKAASIHDLCITPKDFTDRLGDFKQYCPVHLADSQELLDCSVTKSLQFAVEFRGYYHKCCNQDHLSKFMATPDQYVPPLARWRLPAPEMLPKRLTAAAAKQSYPSQQMELAGYCPVTFLDGKQRYEAIIPGNVELGVVLYRNRLFCFESEEKLQKFMRLPEKYSNLKLPHKLPPKADPMQTTLLPMLGYLEQSVATCVTKALTAVGCLKPKYPFLSPQQSALIYLAHYLKAFNPRSSDYVRRKHKKQLDKFEETCELIKYLGDNMTTRYREPDARPAGFNDKLSSFLGLRPKQHSRPCSSVS